MKTINPFYLQLLTLSLFTLLMGITFCDGFKLHVVRKLIWFVSFAAIAFYVLKTTGEYDLTRILPVPIILAILLHIWERRSRKVKY
jgi:hypothetical protein